MLLDFQLNSMCPLRRYNGGSSRTVTCYLLSGHLQGIYNVCIATELTQLTYLPPGASDGNIKQILQLAKQSSLQQAFC